MRKLLFLLFALFVTITNAQIVVQNTQTPQELVEGVLLGSGVVATNIKYNGSTVSAQSVQTNVTYFDATGTTFPIVKGVLLTTGEGSVAVGPNTVGSSTLGGTPSVSTDPDLNAIANASVTNGVVLEFDFTASGNTVRFSYMFGSEEYPEFSPSSFNDAFGFFLSGPGIAGPYTNGAINLAVLPSTSTSTNAVTINNVNPTTNSIYYSNNVSGAAYGTAIQYDGTTVELIAVSGLQCGQTYHIKLCISNVGDQSYDSGVFLQADSFSSNVVQVETAGEISGNPYSDSVLAEGCSSATLMFIRPQLNIDSTEVYYVMTGGAVDIDADLQNFIDSVVFDPGIDTVSIVLDPIDDGITEGMEMLEIIGYSLNNCGDTLYDTVHIYIMDKYQLSYDLPDTIVLTCPQMDTVALVSNFMNSIPPYGVTWEDNQTVNPGAYTTSVTNHDEDYFTVDITDGCGTHYLDSVLMLNDFPLTATLSSTPTSSCISDGTASSVINGATGTPTYEWIGPGLADPDTMTTQNITDIPSGWYYFTVTDDICWYTDSIEVSQTEAPHAYVSADPMQATAPYTFTFSNTSQNASTYSWNFGNGELATTSDLSSQTSTYTESGFYSIFLIAIEGPCSDTAVVVIELFDDPLIVNVPNVFTPNGDSENDEYYIQTLNVAKLSLTVTDRWGKVVYQKEDANPKWDGKDPNGNEMSDGVFFYQYLATGFNGKTLEGHGFFHLLKDK